MKNKYIKYDENNNPIQVFFKNEWHDYAEVFKIYQENLQRFFETGGIEPVTFEKWLISINSQK